MYSGRALALLRKLLPSNLPNIAGTLIVIGRANDMLGNVAAAVDALVTSFSMSRRSQTRCSWTQLCASRAGGRRAAGRVRELPTHLLLWEGVPDRGLDGGAQEGVQGAAGGGEGGGAGG